MLTCEENSDSKKVIVWWEVFSILIFYTMRPLNKFKLFLTPYNYCRNLKFSNTSTSIRLLRRNCFVVIFLYHCKDELAFLVRRQMIPRCGILCFREVKLYGEKYNLKRNSSCRAIMIVLVWAKDIKMSQNDRYKVLTC